MKVRKEGDASPAKVLSLAHKIPAHLYSD